MKAIKSVIVFLFIAWVFSSYSQTICYDGFETFDKNNYSDFEINAYILPTDDFASRFEYLDIDYHFRAYYKTPFTIIGTERSIVVAEYEQSVYEQAKAFCFEEMQLSDSNIMEYNGYTFIENTRLVADYPEYFNMFAYNDDLNTLVFMGFFDDSYTTQEAEHVSANWGEFLDKNFSDLYDFTA